MAASIAFGVLFGTIFILFFYPSAIILWNQYRRLGQWFRNGKVSKELELAEPVIRNKKQI